MTGKKRNLSLILIIFLGALNLGVWFQIFFAKPVLEPQVYFLDVGQGDATLAVFPGGVKVLTDAGPNLKILESLETVGLGDKYVDLAVISHPQLDHFNGLNYLLGRYRFGTIILNGRESDLPEWKELMEKIKSEKVPVITLAEGDRIKNGENVIDFISPTKDFIQSAELNDTGLIELIQTEKLKLLLTGDIGANVEKYLVEKFGDKLAADILKVSHHGSKFSSSEEFLKTVQPKVAVIEVGENRYGHPTRETLDRLEAAKAKVFRTDRDGTLKLVVQGDKMMVFETKGTGR